LSTPSLNETKASELAQELTTVSTIAKTADTADTNRQVLITISDLIDFDNADSTADSSDNANAGNVVKPNSEEDLVATDSNKTNDADNDYSQPKLRDKEYPPIDAVVGKLKQMIFLNDYRPCISIENYVSAAVKNCDRTRLEELLTDSEWEVVEASVWV
jgi:hypothetical protein